MPDYAAMYRKLAAAQVDAIEGFKTILAGMIQAQQEAEEMYMESPQPALYKLPNSGVAQKGKAE